jgi:hypothetical protein
MFDKVVEFGMGMTMVRQMPQMMDMAMPKQTQNNTTPPVIRPDIANVYIANNRQQAGPFSELEVKQLMNNGVLTPNTMVWMPNMSQWMPACQVPAINKLFLLMSVPQKNTPNSSQIPLPPSSPRENLIRNEVVAAIAQLGYSSEKVLNLINETISQSPSLSTKEIIKNVLTRL